MFERQKEYTSEEFKNLISTNVQVERCKFNACSFLKCAFQEASFEYCTFHDCNFRGCDLSLIKLTGCTFKNTSFEDTKIIGVDWIDTNLSQMKYVLAKPVDFVKCILNHSTFMGLNLRGIRLTRCIAREVSFEEADMSHTDCTCTDFTGSSFLHTNLTEADFTGATNYAISANLNTLKKTRFSLPEALTLLYSLDIVLTEDEADDTYSEV
jgi:fluoroquinolone resistance protein